MNGAPTYVTTGTLNTAERNNTTILSGDVADEVRKLKDQEGGDILTLLPTKDVGSAVVLQEYWPFRPTE
jgi:hypothetical protein